MARKVALVACVIAAGWVLAVATAPILSPPLASAVFFLSGKASVTAAATANLPQIGAHTVLSHIGYAIELLRSDSRWVFLLLFAIYCILFLAAIAYEKTVNPSRSVKNGIFETGKVYTLRQEIIRRCHMWDGGKPECYGIASGCIKGRIVVFPATHAVCIAPSGSGKTRRSLYETADLLTHEGEKTPSS